MEIMMMTAATPMMMPNIVNKERILLRTTPSQEIPIISTGLMMPTLLTGAADGELAVVINLLFVAVVIVVSSIRFNLSVT